MSSVFYFLFKLLNRKKLFMKSTLSTITIAVLALITACNNQSTQTTTLTPQEGYIHVTGGKVWYKIYGSGNKTPLLLLHGGPGVPSYYLKPMSVLSKDRPVIFLDQLGCGRSDRITDTSFMTIQFFVDELKQVVDSLHLKNYYLYGHSWGTMLGTEFYLQHPEGINALILASPALDVSRWIKDADSLLTTLPDSSQQAIKINEQRKTFEDSAYQQAVQLYYQKYLARKLPWSADIDSAFMQAGQNIYLYMEGPSEFSITGNLANYNATGRLPNIKIPTLFMCGEYDEARPSTVKYFQSLVPNAKFAEIPGAGHLTMQDNADDNNKAIEEFLAHVEGNNK